MRLNAKSTGIIVFGLVLALCAATWLQGWRRRTAGFTHWDGKPFPEGGLVVNPRGVNPGDPANAERDFRRLYPAILASIEKTGKIPSLYALAREGAMVDGTPIGMEDVENPDVRFADSQYKKLTPGVIYYTSSYLSPRPDGRPKPPRPKPGERDVWFVVDFYERRNQVVERSGRSTMKWTGCHVVLWSDGKIERIKPGDLLVQPLDYRTSTHTYPGQTGNPKGLKTAREAAKEDTYNRITFED